MNEILDRDLMIALPQEQDVLSVFTRPNGIRPFLDMVREKIDAFEGDASTEAGRKKIKSFAHKITKSKTALEEVGKQLAAEQKEIPKKIDAARKAWRETLDAWHEEVRRPVTEWESAEEARIDRHKTALQNIADLGTLTGQENLVDLERRLAALHGVALDETCEEFATEYAIAREQSLGALNLAIPRREQFEKDQADLARLRAAEAERQKEVEAERLRKEGEERARLEAEADARAEKERAERKLADEKAAAEKRERELIAEKEAAERRAVEAAAQAKRELEAQKAAEDAEQKRREADKAHKTKINRAALAALVEGGLSEDTAKLVIKLIASGKVPAVQIHY